MATTGQVMEVLFEGGNKESGRALEKYSRGDKGLFFIQLCKLGVIVLYTLFIVPKLCSSFGFMPEGRLRMYRFLFYLAPFLLGLGTSMLSLSFFTSYDMGFGKYRKRAVAFEGSGSLVLLFSGLLILAKETPPNGSADNGYLGLFFIGLSIASTIYVSFTLIKYDIEKINE
jgi:hypothetical protein